jgi:carboxyl-terminal processing protease
MLFARQLFANYAQKYTAEGDTRVSLQSTGRRLVKPNFAVDDTMLGDFREYLRGEKIKIDNDGFNKDVEFIKAMIRLEIDTPLFGVAEARRHLIAVDPQAQAALGMFGEAQKLTDLARAAAAKKALH